MKYGYKKKIIASLLFAVFISFISCHLLKKKEYGIFRIVDNLSDKNIIESPFKDLIKQFNFIEEDINGKWKYLPELSNKDQKTWGFSTAHSILGNHESETPEEIKLLKNGKEVEYLSNLTKEDERWRWIDTDETLDLKSYDAYDNKLRGIVLKKGNSFKFEKLLPNGEVMIDLYIVNKNWETYIPRLEITFNNSDTEELIITRKKWFRIRNEVNLGKYLIEIKFVDSEGGAEGKEEKFVVIGNIKLQNSSDILLLFTSPKEKKVPTQGNYQLQYYNYDSLSKEKNQPALLRALYLYNLKYKFLIHDESISNNPYSIKKKIVIDEYSLNSLLAPPRSEFTIPIKIFSKATLELGYGFLTNKSRQRESNKIINFKILIKDSCAEKILLNRAINWETYKEIIQEKIDLSLYKGKKVKLSFITEEIQSNDEEDKNTPIIPIWVNPLINQIPEKAHTNVVLISLDTLRPDHLSCYGYHRNTSPAIDLLAEDGVLFLNTFSTTSWTLPGHVSMLTSLDCLHHQVYYPLQKMEVDTITLADILRANQFYCAAFTGGGYLSATYGFSKGFDSYQEIKLHGDKAIRFDEAERLSKLACDWLDNNGNKKFFLFLHTYQPHDPYANPSPLGKAFLNDHSKWDQIKMESLFEEKGRFETQFSDDEKQNIIDLYDGEIKYTDSLFVKPILDKLKELNIYDNTMIILTSDHGEEFYDHEAWLHDHSVYNEGIKIPLIIKFLHFNHKGTRIKKTARITDIMPTILDQMNIKSNNDKFDGKTLFLLLEGKEKHERAFISDLALRNFKIPPTIISINQDQFKLILNKQILSPYVKRKIKNFNVKKIELYDIEKDPKEENNLALNIAYRDIVFKLIKKINMLYEKADLQKKGQKKVVLDKSLEERLRSLGYIK